ncbi:A-agglutinin anchorage subunit-like [Strongylocentrotus purpuratus]|uniref:C-type lectin domain-containing protein n=1 Tax=Strongylocentrotus purpuratus TaxID=7668 RepID=A0A7M7NP84_STRPU|nr:A-agglutinin anchorage subunit-like [Strongylocentrotus purpuratus]
MPRHLPHDLFFLTDSTEEATTKPTTSPSTTMTERSDSKTSQSTTTSEWEAKSKSATSPTATMPERSDATTSQETTTSQSAESSTTDVTTKPTMSPTATVSDTTTSPETTASTCSSPPVDCEFGGSFYNFSTSEMNHSSAVSACSQYGSHLVFIESQEEQDFIAERASENYWIGLTGLSLSEARWLDGSSLTYKHFTQGSFRENVNCFQIWFDSYQESKRYSWQDKHCSRRLRFICEKKVGI